jgi:transcriptional regulator with XRE-family HTH domain
MTSKRNKPPASGPDRPSRPARTAEDLARYKAIRERFQREKPSLEELVSSGEYNEPLPLGEYLSLRQAVFALKKAREAAGLSLADVAERSGIDKAALSRIETGQHPNPTVSTLGRYAHALGKRWKWVLEDEAIPGREATSGVRCSVAQGSEMPFTLWFDDICAQPARAVLELVQQAEKKPLGDLRIYDLLREGDRHLLKGVYFFYSADGQCLYVGKNSAQKFVERIPIHLSLAENSWMNYLVKKMKRFEGYDSLQQAAEAARTHTLLLMPVGCQEQIASLERFFRMFGCPKYNAFSPKRRGLYAGLDLGKPLTEVLKFI